jgi:hypothetical protein
MRSIELTPRTIHQTIATVLRGIRIAFAFRRCADNRISPSSDLCRFGAIRVANITKQRSRIGVGV